MLRFFYLNSLIFIYDLLKRYRSDTMLAMRLRKANKDGI